MTTQSAPQPDSRRPRLRVERSLEQPRWLSILSPFILIIAALLVGAILLSFAGADPWLVYRLMAKTAYGDAYGWSDTTIRPVWAESPCRNAMPDACGIESGSWNSPANSYCSLSPRSVNLPGMPRCGPSPK